jgi:hypothetical protein
MSAATAGVGVSRTPAILHRPQAIGGMRDGCAGPVGGATMTLVNDELRSLLAADQDDRKDGRFAPGAAARDRMRLRRVKELLDAGVVETAEDLFCAAMILQHGSSLDDYWQAHQLASASAEGGHRPGRWLAAAAFDRWLMHQGKPQRYGTQYFAIAGDSPRLWEVDPTTTDADRAEWDVPPLGAALARVGGRVQPASITFDSRTPRRQ